ncbi:unnamed protein product [Cuscuta campestris]|uniref:Zinc finger, CCHC-type n=1 Tax=Cuscuta campestris TaxID=132261 RepID=A0A484LD22_9ASTE|nr:unnamed protein product [Cuscuta campestris]
MEDHSSTSGWIFLLGGGAIAGKEAEWLRNLIYDIPLWPKPISPISIRCDSEATLAKAYSQVYNGKSRHLGARIKRTTYMSRVQGATPFFGELPREGSRNLGKRRDRRLLPLPQVYKFPQALVGFQFGFFRAILIFRS